MHATMTAMARGRGHRPPQSVAALDLAIADLRSAAIADPQIALALAELEGQPHRPPPGHPSIDAVDVARLLPWDAVIVALRREPQIGDGQVSISEGDYNSDEEWEAFGVETTLAELLRETTGSEAGTPWNELLDCLSPELASRAIAVVEGDYGWEGWEEFEVEKTLEELVRSALAGVLWESANPHL